MKEAYTHKSYAETATKQAIRPSISAMRRNQKPNCGSYLGVQGEFFDHPSALEALQPKAQPWLVSGTAAGNPSSGPVSALVVLAAKDFGGRGSLLLLANMPIVPSVGMFHCRIQGPLASEASDRPGVKAGSSASCQLAFSAQYRLRVSL